MTLASTGPATNTRLVDVGGRNLSATVLGEGEPFVLLEVGFGAESESWLPVAQAVSAFTRVCFYDRAGRGDSDPAPQPRNADSLVQDARGIVHALAGSVAPVVLVGQSFGGLIARLYAHRYPAEVAGVVLVDSMHEEQFDRCAQLMPPPFPGEPAVLTSMRAFWSGGWRDPSQNKEQIDMVACQVAGREIKTLGDMPLRVLTASTWTFPARMPPEASQPLQAAWEALGREFTQLSTNSSQTILADSGHFVQTDKPQAVIDAIARLVAEVRGEQ